MSSVTARQLWRQARAASRLHSAPSRFVASAYHTCSRRLLPCSLHSHQLALTLSTPSVTLHSIPHRCTHISVGQRESDALPELVDIPSYITPVALATLLDVTLRRLAKDARHHFPAWWPQSITERRMLRTGYSNVKEVVLSYSEAAAIAQLYNRQPQRRIMDGTDIQPVLPARPVVRQAAVCVLGHKDHGKTSLLDALRGTSVAAREEFGITQETYTYEVTLDELTTDTERQRYLAGAQPAGRRRTFTFLDTPGHHSFTEMRAQAAAHADLILLVVAADEGLLEQTFECLNIITEFRVPVIVVLSKVDKEGAAVGRIRRELQRLGARLLTASRPTASVRGEMVAVEVSAKTGQGMELLRRALFGVTELLPLAADANLPCSGGVVEAWREEKRRGEVVRLLVKQGTLRTGDWLVADTRGGRIKAMHDMRRRPLKQCAPGQVCEVMGVEGLPSPGKEFFVCSREAMEAITEVRRLEQEYAEQPRLQKRQRRRVEEEKDDELQEEGESVETTAQPAAEAADASTLTPTQSRRIRSPAPSYFSAPGPPQPVDKPAPRAYDALVAADDYNPLPVVIKANSVGQLHMVSCTDRV